jgi:protein-tyrosine phosphatase
MQDRLIPLDGPANFRDVGGYENVHGQLVRTGRLYRSDSLSYMTDDDVRHVIEVLGLRTVIDLRGVGEVTKFTHGPLGSLGVNVSHIPIIDETRPPPAGWEDARNQPLDGLYLLMLDRFGASFVDVLRLIANEQAQPLVFHCAAGKDRTGLVAMLVLGLLDVAPDVIAADYGLTHERMPFLLERHQARAADGAIAEVAEQHYAVDAVAMRAVIEHLNDDYGSVEGYVRAQGLEPEALRNLRASLLEMR